MSEYRYLIIKKHNLIVAKITNKELIYHTAIQMCQNEVIEDENYSEGMDVIIDIRSADMPTEQIYYNDLDIKCDLSVRLNKYVRIVNENNKDVIDNHRLFEIFKKKNADVYIKGFFTHDLEGALKIVNKQLTPEETDIINTFLA